MTTLEFKESLLTQGINFTSEMEQQFIMYLELLQEWNAKMDLTAIREEEEIIEKHFFDSLLISKIIPPTIHTVLDLGSGAGFPGIPLKIVFPHLEIILLEPTAKRGSFLNAVIQKLGLKGISTVCERAEIFVNGHREKFDMVVARAVAKMNIILELAVPLIKVNGYFVAMKGQKAIDELNDAQPALKELNCQVINTFEEKLPKNHDARYNILVQKLARTNNKYPRQYGTIKNRPL